MTDDLHDRLTEIDGIGDARADEIIDIVEVSSPDAGADVVKLLEEAIDHFDESEYADITAQQGFTRTRRALEQLTSD